MPTTPDLPYDATEEGRVALAAYTLRRQNRILARNIRSAVLAALEGYAVDSDLPPRITKKVENAIYHVLSSPPPRSRTTLQALRNLRAILAAGTDTRTINNAIDMLPMPIRIYIHGRFDTLDNPHSYAAMAAVLDELDSVSARQINELSRFPI